MRRALALLLLSGLAVAGLTPPLQWIRLDTLASGAQPPQLKDAILGYDQASNTLLLFGGESPAGTFSPNTYILNMSSLQWSTPPPAQPPIPTNTPSGRSQAIGGSEMAANYRDDFIMFGGQNSTGAINEVWLYNWKYQFWYQMPTSGTPPAPRWGATGGPIPNDPDTNLQTNFFVAGGMDGQQVFPLDVYQLTLNGTLAPNFVDVQGVWENLSPQTHPGRVGQAGAVTADGHLAAFGGCDSSAPQPYGTGCSLQTSLAFATKTPVSTTWNDIQACPAPRFASSMAANLNTATSQFESQVFLLFGAADSASWSGENDTQGEIAILDTAQGTWMFITPTGDPAANPKYPVNRQGAAAVSYGPSIINGLPSAGAADTIIYGGVGTDGTFLSDLWLLRAYPAVLQTSDQQWSGFGNGTPKTGINADGTGVTVKMSSTCANFVGSSSTTSPPTTTPPITTQTSYPTDPNHSNSNSSSGLVTDVSVVHKALAPVSTALILAAMLSHRLSTPASQRPIPDSRRVGYRYMAIIVGITAYALGVVAFAVSFATTTVSTPSSATKRSGSQGTFLVTDHGKAGFAIFIALYGVILLLIASHSCCQRQNKRASIVADESHCVRSDKSTDASIGPRHAASPSLTLSEPGLETPSERQRTLSTPMRKLLSLPSGWGPGRRKSESDTSPADAVRSTSSGENGQVKSFEVIRPHRISGSGARLLNSDGHARNAPSFSAMANEVEQRRSASAVDELGYAMNHFTPEPSIPFSPIESFPPVTPLGRPRGPTFPRPLCALGRILFHAALLAASVFTLVELDARGPIAAFAIFLVWCVACYLAIFWLAWNGQPQQSILTAAIYRLRGHHEVAQMDMPVRPLPTPLQAEANVPSSSSSRGPYYHHPPYRLAPSHAEDEEFPRRGMSPYQRTVDTDHEDSDEDDDAQQQQLEMEQQRREVVTIVSVPRKRLFVTNS